MNAKKAGYIYLAALAGSAGVSYLRGRRGQDMLVDTVKHGFVVGTGAVAVGYALDLVGVEVPVLSNPSEHAAMGNMPKKAVALLAKVPAKQLFAPMKKGGVKVAPVPADEMTVEQDEV